MLKKLGFFISKSKLSNENQLKLRLFQVKRPLRNGFVILIVSASLIGASNYNANARLEFDKDRGVMTMAPLLEKTTPAVVNIAVESQLPANENPLMRDPRFRRFFGAPENVPQRKARSAGSGVIVDAEKGYILTNHHVVNNAAQITVTVKDGRKLIAKFIGSDPATDIGVLKVDAKNLTQLKLGDSDLIKVGDLAVAIGNPFGLGQTVTTGIISALGRSGLSAENYEDFIQTDASINPGNSGGALISSKGELIGINTAIIAPSGGNVGIGFAVPSNMAKAVMDQILKYGEVRRGRIGITVQSMSSELAKALGLSVKRGAVITSVAKNSSAGKSGLKPGDAIVEIDGKSIEDADDVRNSVGLRERGSTIELAYFRKGKRFTTKVTIGDPQKTEVKVTDTISKFSGAQFTKIPDNHPSKSEFTGVFVSEVTPGSPAWRNGLRAEDIILQVNQKKISSVREFIEIVKNAESVVTLNILRDENEIFIVVQ